MKENKVVALSLLTLLAFVFVGCTPTEKPTNTTNSSTVTSSTTMEISSTEKSTPSEKEQTLEEIIEIYQKEYPDTDITSIDYDTSFNKWYFKMDGINDTTEFELQIDPITGEVSRKKEEALDKDEATPAYREKKKLDLTNLASLDDIRKAAVEAIGTGKATDLELEKELNVTYWTVTVEDGNKEHEVKINAQTKEILETDLDD